MTQSTLPQVKACSVLHRQSLVFLLIPDHLQQLYNWTSLCRETDRYFQMHFLILWITKYTTSRWAMLSCTIIDQVTCKLPQHKYGICRIESNASIFIKLKILFQWMLYFHVQCQILIIKPTRCTNYSNLSWNETPRALDISSVHHQEFFNVNTAMVYVIQADSKPVWHIPWLCVQWKIPDDGQRNCLKHVVFHSKINLRN
jgi:hypothetical protein